QRVPFDLIARECTSPAAILVQLVSVPICTGECSLVEVPVPNCPNTPTPQPHNVPFDISARECEFPALICDHLVTVPTITGLFWLVVFPVPNCPTSEAPQAQRLPCAYVVVTVDNNATNNIAIPIFL